jgi:hypothetical protein
MQLSLHILFLSPVDLENAVPIAAPELSQREKRS